MITGLVANVQAAGTRVRAVITVAATLPWLAGAPVPVATGPFLTASPRDGWTVLRVHTGGRTITKWVGNGSVLTLGIIFPLEVGATIDPALVTGVFEWRTARCASPE